MHSDPVRDQVCSVALHPITAARREGTRQWSLRHPAACQPSAGRCCCPQTRTPPAKKGDTKPRYTHTRTQTHAQLPAVYPYSSCLSELSSLPTKANTHAYARMRLHTRLPTRLHTRLHTHAYTHAYTHAPTHLLKSRERASEVHGGRVQAVRPRLSLHSKGDDVIHGAANAGVVLVGETT